MSDEATGDKPRPARPKSTKRSGENWDQKFRRHIDAMSREQLAELVWSLTERFADLRDEFREQIALGAGDVDQLVAEARKELRRVTAQSAWRDSWNERGEQPDYSKLCNRLERLIELGHADAVARLGDEILRRGIEQVSQSHDDGDTAYELNSCLAIVFKAVAKSSLSGPKKLIFAIKATLADDYGVVDDAGDVVLNAQYKPDDWSIVADDLARVLAGSTPARTQSAAGTLALDDDDDEDDEDDEDDNFSRNYERDKMSDWLGRALENADRSDEVAGLYEREARITGSYERLVKFLVGQKRFDEARQWAREGIKKTAAKHLGTAAALAQQLRDVARIHEQWDVVAAHAAYEFFEGPSPEGLSDLLAAAEKAGCREAVRSFAQGFLENGVPSVRSAPLHKGGHEILIAKDWPLPTPDYLEPLMRPHPQV